MLDNLPFYNLHISYFDNVSLLKARSAGVRQLYLITLHESGKCALPQENFLFILNIFLKKTMFTMLS